MARKPGRCRAPSRQRPAPALRADLEAHRREPDGVGAARPGRRRHRRPERPASGCARPARSSCSTASSRSTRRTATTPAEEEGEGRRLPAMREGERLGARRGHAEPAFHPAAAALHRGEPRQEARRARHRPALDLRLDHPGAAGPRLCPARQAALRAGGPRPARHRVSDQLLRALRRVQFHRRSRKPARRRLGRARSTGRRCCAISGAISRPRSTAPRI